MYLRDFFAPQSGKLRKGYFLNHDSIAGLTPVDRKKLITFYIACQTNEKLDPKDRELFVRYYYEKVRAPSVAFGVVATVNSPFLYYKFWTKYQPRTGLRFLYYTGFSAVLFSFYKTVATNFFENILLHSDLTLKLAYKYNFTLFDFAQAKKESHLKHLRKMLVDESHVSSLFTSPE